MAKKRKATKKKKPYNSIKAIKSKVAAKKRIVKINTLADAEQKKSGSKSKTVKVYNLDRKTALKRAGKKYKKMSK